jgi:hypothetical protein
MTFAMDKGTLTLGSDPERYGGSKCSELTD